MKNAAVTLVCTYLLSPRFWFSWACTQSTVPGSYGNSVFNLLEELPCWWYYVSPTSTPPPGHTCIRGIFPSRGSNPCPWKEKHGILAPAPPGKPQCCVHVESVSLSHFQGRAVYFIFDSTALPSSLSGVGSSICYTDLTEECPCSSPRELAPESREEFM